VSRSTSGTNNLMDETNMILKKEEALREDRGAISARSNHEKKGQEFVKKSLVTLPQTVFRKVRDERKRRKSLRYFPGLRE